MTADGHAVVSADLVSKSTDCRRIVGVQSVVGSDGKSRVARERMRIAKQEVVRARVAFVTRRDVVPDNEVSFSVQFFGRGGAVLDVNICSGKHDVARCIDGDFFGQRSRCGHSGVGFGDGRLEGVDAVGGGSGG